MICHNPCYFNWLGIPPDIAYFHRTHPHPKVHYNRVRSDVEGHRVLKSSHNLLAGRLGLAWSPTWDVPTNRSTSTPGATTIGSSDEFAMSKLALGHSFSGWGKECIVELLWAKVDHEHSYVDPNELEDPPYVVWHSGGYNLGSCHSNQVIVHDLCPWDSPLLLDFG